MQVELAFTSGDDEQVDVVVPEWVSIDGDGAVMLLWEEVREGRRAKKGLYTI